MSTFQINAINASSSLYGFVFIGIQGSSHIRRVIYRLKKVGKVKSPILRCFFKKDKESKNQEKSSHCLDKMQIHPDTSDAVCAFFLILSQIMQ